MGNTDLTKSQDKSQCALKPKKCDFLGTVWRGVFLCFVCCFFCCVKIFHDGKSVSVGNVT